MLELLLFYLELKCIPTIFNAYHEHTFNEVFIIVDSQISLSWILSGETKTKSVFVKNRITDIKAMIAKYECEYKKPLNFRYVN